MSAQAVTYPAGYNDNNELIYRKTRLKTRAIMLKSINANNCAKTSSIYLFKYMHISDLHKLLPFIIGIIMKTKTIDSETVINFMNNEITLNYLSFSYVVGRLCFLTR